MNVYKGKEYGALLQPLWLLRARMAFVVDNLQSYLQVDVFDVAYARLCSKISKSTDFESVKRAHQEFLSNVTVHSYLRDRVRGAHYLACRYARLVHTRVYGGCVADPARLHHQDAAAGHGLCGPR